jgi:hypothetical protein
VICYLRDSRLGRGVKREGDDKQPTYQTKSCGRSHRVEACIPPRKVLRSEGTKAGCWDREPIIASRYKLSYRYFSHGTLARVLKRGSWLVARQVASIGENGIGDDDYCNRPSLAFRVICCPRAAACSLTGDCLRLQSSSLALTDQKLLRAI